MQLDPYENSLRHAGTYLLVSDLTQAAVWTRWTMAVLSLHSIGSLTRGFRVVRSSSVRRWRCSPRDWELDGAIRWPNTTARESAPLGDMRLKRNGETVETSIGYESDFEVKQSGVYRVELWLEGLEGRKLDFEQPDLCETKSTELAKKRKGD